MDNYKEIIIRPVDNSGNSTKIRVLPEKGKTLYEKMLEIMEEKIF